MDLSNIHPLKHGPASVTFRESLDPVKLGLDIGLMHFESPLIVEGEMNIGEREVLMQARVVGTKKFTCSRCLETFNKPFEKEVTLDLEFEKNRALNVLPELSEELLVDNPIYILCREDCRGLCPRCGANLNAGPCTCK